ncbi:hypothetical protein M408DRAFT_330909 [Serendipita vermifera MAFF 305830]|uniref:Uncharacterized protein n=1 Tax=Serendipita vermifera MAFF 305830 TaxID=933852 RepID=A0A0C2WHQ0_SERVB|nr:hypothetical protein M408DRAFT_330909 [Serendipita vermifera MAFF 305830]
MAEAEFKPRPIVPLTPEEEENLVNTRLAMEDRQQVRRVTKRWQMHVNSDIPHPESSEHFLLELESFRLAYRKNDIIVRAEERQVIEYQESKTRLEQEVIQVLDEIEKLKLTLEESQEHRRRKIAYDEIADKINELPSRAEQENQINALLAEVAAIKEEKAADDRVKEERKQGLAELNRVFDLLRIVGKGAGAVVQDSDALVHEVTAVDGDVDMASTQPIEGEMEEGEEREVDSQVIQESRTTSTLNPLATEFHPQGSGSAALLMRNRVLRGDYSASTPGAGSPIVGSPAPASGDADVEMGEIQSQPKDSLPIRPPSEELEEGEASDNSTLSSLDD